MKHIMLILMTFALGCTAHKSKMNTFKLDIEPFAAPAPQTGCGWVTVDETYSTKFLGLKLGSTSRQYNKSLYYCCPGESQPEPICYQTQWVSK